MCTCILYFLFLSVVSNFTSPTYIFSKSASHVFEVAAGETLDITVYTKAKNGAMFSVSTEDKKQVFVEKVDITFKGNGNADNESPETVKLAEGLKGPMKYKVKAEAKSGALSYDNYLLSYSVC